MTFIYELDPYSLNVQIWTFYVKDTTVIVWQTDRQTRPKLQTTPHRGWWTIMQATKRVKWTDPTQTVFSADTRRTLTPTYSVETYNNYLYDYYRLYPHYRKCRGIKRCCDPSVCQSVRPSVCPSSGVASYGALEHVPPLDFQRFHF